MVFFMIYFLLGFKDFWHFLINLRASINNTRKKHTANEILDDIAINFDIGIDSISVFMSGM